MSKGNVFIPQKGLNFQGLIHACKKLDQRVHFIADQCKSLAKLTRDNCRIITQLIIITDLLKEKGLYTDEEFSNAYIKYEEKIKAGQDILNPDKKDSDGSPVQSKPAGTDVDSSGHEGLTLLRDESDSGDSGSERVSPESTDG